MSLDGAAQGMPALAFFAFFFPFLLFHFILRLLMTSLHASAAGPVAPDVNLSHQSLTTSASIARCSGEYG